MQHTPVSSSNLKSVGYDAEAAVLEIAFHSGGVYRYSAVSGATYSGLMSARSKGQYFEQLIRYRYPTTKMR
jgi:KTSC domain